MLFVRHALLTLLLAATIAATVTAWIIVGGHFDVSVTAQLPKPVHDLIHQTRVNAVRREARRVQAPAVELQDESVLFQAVLEFQALCADCHHPPGGQPSALARALNPRPANLQEAAGKRSLAELFWVTKHGIRMSGMPAWGNLLDDEDLWAIATLVARFPDFRAEDYEALLRSARDAADGHRHDHGRHHDTADPGLPDEHNLWPQAIASGRFTYLTELQVGDTALEIESLREIRRESFTDGPRLFIETTSLTGMGETADRLVLDGATLYPLQREIIQGDGQMQLQYERHLVTGFIRAAGQSISVHLALSEAAYAGDAGLDTLLAALDLHSGLSGRLQIIETDVDVHLQAFDFQVGEPEDVTVPAGDFEAWPIDIQAGDDPDYRQTVWISTRMPRFLVRAEAPVPIEAGGGVLRTQLTALADE